GAPGAADRGPARPGHRGPRRRANTPRREALGTRRRGTRGGRSPGGGRRGEAPAPPDRAAQAGLRARRGRRARPGPGGALRHPLSTRRVKLRIGTRRSRLALAQAGEVAERLAELGIETELVPLSTAGDRGAP